MYTNKKILITGGTGTIGQHLVRRILRDAPAVIRIFSRDEYKQFEMQQALYEHQTTLRYLIGDIRDADRLTRAMEGIDYVFHLAAMKHVPACEYNPFEAVQTNVIGTQNVIQAAIQAGVQKVLFTSTDKAISPTNTYGATKLTAERLISAAEFQKGAKQTIFSSVRFGNVMGSRGSVIPLFLNQMKENRSITITDPEMLRYMMTPGQAIELMLKANSLAHGGEVFVLKMPVIKMGDLALVLIEEKTRGEVASSIEVKTIGLRPGEKRYEELMSHEEYMNALELEDMYVIQSTFSERRSYPTSEIATRPNLDQETPIGPETIRQWLVAEKLMQ